MSTNTAKRNIYVGKWYLAIRLPVAVFKHVFMAWYVFRLLYLGGLADEADEKVVSAAFIPFGDIINIEIPPDYENQEKHRGFAFIEYELAEDAAAAIDNMVSK